jgi:hypothetical protein
MGIDSYGFLRITIDSYGIPTDSYGYVHAMTNKISQKSMETYEFLLFSYEILRVSYGFLWFRHFLFCHSMYGPRPSLDTFLTMYS